MRWSLWNLFVRSGILHLLGYVEVTKDEHVPLAVMTSDGYQRVIFPFCSFIIFLWSVCKEKILSYHAMVFGELLHIINSKYENYVPIFRRAWLPKD